MSEAGTLHAIQSAEEQRAQHDYRRAIDIAQYATRPGLLAEFPTLSVEEQQAEMMLLRVLVSSMGSYATTHFRGSKAAQQLLEEGTIIRDYYHDRNVQSAALDMRVAYGLDDPQHRKPPHEYIMAAEMARDEAERWMKIAKLTDNPGFIDYAIEAYNRAIHLSAQTTSVNALARMELFTAQRRRGARRDFREYTQAYDQVLQRSRRDENWDRGAASSWRYMIESLAEFRFGQTRRGYRNLRESLNGHMSVGRYVRGRFGGAFTNKIAYFTFGQSHAIFNP